jgi:hypothetical protein
LVLHPSLTNVPQKRGGGENALFTMQPSALASDRARWRFGRGTTMAKNIIKIGTTAMLMSLITVNQAFAWCLWGKIGTTCGGSGSTPPAPTTPAAPEIDGAGAMVAIALLVSIAAIVYRRVLR